MTSAVDFFSLFLPPFLASNAENAANGQGIKLKTMLENTGQTGPDPRHPFSRPSIPFTSKPPEFSRKSGRGMAKCRKVLGMDTYKGVK